MKRLRMDRKGQFSIIASLFVAVILITSVMLTYSTIRYNSNQTQPQIMSAVDETNLSLKQVLGFTVGYYGSILQVTGNSSYAYDQSESYLNSGLNNIVDVNPKWGTSFAATDLSLGTNWFTNSSFSEGNLTVTYDLTGLGVYGVAYSISAELSVQVLHSPSNSQVCLTVIQDGNQPVVNLGKSNFKFYQYQDSNLTWGMVSPPDSPIASSSGTYTIDIPAKINSNSFIVQVQDSRGMMVAASSFSHYTGTLTFNSTTVIGGSYVNKSNAQVDGQADQGTHSAFAVQQQAPNGTYDVMTEAATGTQSQNYFPDSYGVQSGASYISGSLSNLNKDDYSDMTFQSYASTYSATQYSTTTHDYSNQASTTGASSLLWTHNTGTGNDRILLVGVNTFSYTGTPATVSSVYYGSTQLTSSYTVLYSSNPQVRSYIFYLINPVSGTYTITVSFSSSTAASAGSSTYFNVDQVSPINAHGTNSGSGSSQSISLTTSGSYSKVMYGEIGAQIGSSAYTISDSAQQTKRWSNSGSYKHGSTNYYFAGDGGDASSSSSTISRSWTSTHSVDWGAVAVILQPSKLPTQETCQIIFNGPSNTQSWASINWEVDALASTNAAVNMQLYNFNSGTYPTSGFGFQAGTLTTANNTWTQTITTAPGNYKDPIARWQLCITATASISTPFTVSLDILRFTPGAIIYGANLEEQWTNLNTTTLLHPTLCIDAGTVGSSKVAVDAWNGFSWQTLSTGLVNGWNNMSINSYLTQGTTTFTIKFASSGDSAQSSWQVASVLLRPQSNQDLFDSLQNPAATVAVELLQNGTMIWLGQNLQVTTQLIPIPPVPVKALHVNETINGKNEQVPFQIEDWASSYTVPLGLTNNATVFGNRQMVVFLVNTHVSAFTLWWNGSSQAVQTPLAYTDTHFTTDNTNGNFLSNGKLNLQFGGTPFTATSTLVGSGTSDTATFMKQINTQSSTYGSGIDYVIYNGVVRDVVKQEAEWSNGVTNCPNFYADIVLSLPANASYFTYQLSLMFLNSIPTRTISQLCPISLTSSVGTLQTENGTAQGDPVVASGTQLFGATQTWVHHWSEFINGNSGAGIMYTDAFNHGLYVFDSMSPAAPRGALSADSASQTISLLPVTLNPVTFQNALDVSWYGAVVTFDSSSIPIYNWPQPGLWVLAEMPPTIDITCGN